MVNNSNSSNIGVVNQDGSFEAWKEFKKNVVIWSTLIIFSITFFYFFNSLVYAKRVLSLMEPSFV